jgi:GT2 family glycosyltransferase
MFTSIVIPFFNRHNNLLKVLNALENQTCKDFKVYICAYKADEALKKIISNVKVFCEIINVFGNEWNVSRARNEGIKCFNDSKSTHLILLDSDIVVDQDFIEKHRDNSHAGNVVIGHVSSLNPYDESDFPTKTTDTDNRWKHFDVNNLNVKWPFGWTANIALTRKDLIETVPFFDENFHGWGAEDMEWSYRLSISNWKILFAKECNGNHIPHERNVATNVVSENKNLQYFFKKWPTYEVEIVTWLNDFDACEWFNKYGNILSKFEIRVWEICTKEMTILLVGFSSSDIKNYVKDEHISIKEYSLLGVCLPYKEKDIDFTIISNNYSTLPNFALNRVLEEAERVSKQVVFSENRTLQFA